MKNVLKFSLFLIIGFVLAGCEDDVPKKKPNVPNVDETFTYNPNSLDWELAKRCALYSALAYQETRIIKNNSNQPSKAKFNNLLSHYTTKDIQYYYSPNGKDNFVEDKNFPVVLHAHLKWEGFEKIDSKNYGNNIEHDISYTLAYKEVNGSEILLVVILRGTDGVEWRGNMDVLPDADRLDYAQHYSFQLANLELQKAINNYIRDNTLMNKSINLLITGHSRGAAVANLLAVDENYQKWCNGNVKNVYTYTFATPNNITDFDTEDSNIFNFCFDDDFAPQVPLTAWGYGKNGKTYIARAENLNRDLIDRYIRLSENGRNSVFNYSAVLKVLQEFEKIAPSVGKYYNTEPLLDMGLGYNPRRISLHTYMRNYVAQAAIDVTIGTNNPFGVGKAGLALYNQSRDDQSDVYEIANFFLMEWALPPT